MTQIENSSSNRMNSLTSMSDSLSPTGSFGSSSFNLKKNDHDIFLANLKQQQKKLNNDYFNETSHDKMIELVHGTNEVDVDFRCNTAAINQKQKQEISSYNHTNSNENDSNCYLNDVKVQVYYCGIIMVVYIRHNLRLEDLYELLRNICKFDEQQLFTVKWVDEEGDPCTLSSQSELDESLRLYYLNKESELILHIFPNIPERPGTQCAGEDRGGAA